jgi:hypothetical protein
VGSGSNQDEQQQAMGMIEVYIKGMLTNNKSMDITRLQTILKMLVTGGDSGQRYTLTTGDLEKFLNTLILQEKLELFDGLYALKK